LENRQREGIPSIISIDGPSIIVTTLTKQIFEDADVFPSIIVARKPGDGPVPDTTRVCAIRREQLRIGDLKSQIELEGVPVERARLGSQPWMLEPKGVFALLAKIERVGTPLAEFAQVRPLSGIKTGFNDAYLIDTPTKQALVTADPGCASLIKRYLRGQDIKRWHADWDGLWMIAMKSSGDHAWPWADAGSDAEAVFERTYPSLHAHLKGFEDKLRKRQDQGRHWWELRTCAYWPVFDRPKLIYQDITWNPSFNFDTDGTLSNNTVYFLPTDDLWVLAALNSPAAWTYSWRKAQHGKDEALRFFNTFVEGFPIPKPTDGQRSSCENATRRLIEIAQTQQQTVKDILDWLRVEQEIDKPSLKLQAPIGLDSDTLIAEVKKLRGKKKPLSLAAVRSLRQEHTQTILPAQTLASETRGLEQKVSDLVNDAYGLTPEEVRLMWETAPVRMPILGPTTR